MSPRGCQKTKASLRSLAQRWQRCGHRGWPRRGTSWAPTPTHSLGCESTLGLGTPKGYPTLSSSNSSCTSAAWGQRAPKSHSCMTCPTACSWLGSQCSPECLCLPFTAASSNQSVIECNTSAATPSCSIAVLRFWTSSGLMLSSSPRGSPFALRK